MWCDCRYDANARNAVVNDYGYPILILGSFLEGETILVLGGVAAHMGCFSVPASKIPGVKWDYLDRILMLLIEVTPSSSDSY